MSAHHVASLTGALCLGFVLGLMLGGDTYAIAALLFVSGIAVMLAACAVAAWLSGHR